MGRQKKDTTVKCVNPSRQQMQCVVHDRVWVFHDILLVDGLDSGCTVANVKARQVPLFAIHSLCNAAVGGGALFIKLSSSIIMYIFRVNELTNIPGSNMEVVIFFVGSDRCSTTADGSSVGSSSGSNRGGERRAPREDGPISVCLWTPTKSGRDKRYLVTVAANPG